MANVGRSVNESDSATVTSGTTLNNSTTTTIISANPNRIGLIISSGASTRDFWVKLQPASVDDDKKGIWIHRKNKGTLPWHMDPDNVYKGEVSAIADTGSPIAYVTEY